MTLAFAVLWTACSDDSVVKPVIEESAAGRAGGSMPAVLNGANEQAVALFLDEKIHFLDIPKVIEKVCDKHRNDFTATPSLDDILAADIWARKMVLEFSGHL